MDLGRVRGTVVATIKDPHLTGHRLLVVQPHSFQRQPQGRAFVAVDLVGAGPDEWVLYVKGREAANALADPFNPSDRALLAIVDDIALSQPSE